MARAIIAVAPCPSEVSIGNVVRKQLMVCLIELGLTPVSSARVHPLPAAKKKEKNGLASYFSNPDPLKPSACS